MRTLATPDDAEDQVESGSRPMKTMECAEVTR